MNKSSGFTLLELMIVVAVLAIVVAMALPSAIGARKAGNEASAISSLRTLTTVSDTYHTRFQSYATDLPALSSAGYIDSLLASGTKSGYVFAYAGTTNSWNATATPSAAGNSGDREFLVDVTGVIRFANFGAVTSASTPID